MKIKLNIKLDLTTNEEQMENCEVGENPFKNGSVTVSNLEVCLTDEEGKDILNDEEKDQVISLAMDRLLTKD